MTVKKVNYQRLTSLTAGVVLSSSGIWIGLKLGILPSLVASVVGLG